MRRITWLAISLFLLTLFGYFAWLNNQNVTISLFGSFTVQFSLWGTMLGCLVLGAALTELRLLFKHPDRVMMRLKQRWQNRQQARSDSRRQDFEAACLLRDPEGAQQAFRKITGASDDPRLQVQLLEALEDRLDGAALMKSFEELRSRFPEALGVLLANQKLAMEREEWLLVEQLAREIERLAPGHPGALEGQAALAASREDWSRCLELEQLLLKRLSGSHAAARLARQHRLHQEQADHQPPAALREAS